MKEKIKIINILINKLNYCYCDNCEDWEFECSKNNEFDFEFLESRTDEILRLIQRQGGTI